MSTTKWSATACAPPLSAYQRAVKQKRRVRRAEGEGAVGSKPARPVMNEATAERRTGLRCLRFFVGESVKTAKSQTFLNSLRRLEPPRQRAARRSSQITQKTINNQPSRMQAAKATCSRLESLRDIRHFSYIADYSIDNVLP